MNTPLKNALAAEIAEVDPSSLSLTRNFHGLMHYRSKRDAACRKVLQKENSLHQPMLDCTHAYLWKQDAVEGIWELSQLGNCLL